MDLRDKKIGAELWMSGCTGRGYVKLKKSVHGLLWAELCQLMDEWGKFKNRKKGTRFDTWLGEEEQVPRVDSEKVINHMVGSFILIWRNGGRHAAELVKDLPDGRCVLKLLTGPDKGSSIECCYAEQKIEVFQTAKEVLARLAKHKRADKRAEKERAEYQADVDAGRVVPCCENLNEAKGRFVVVRNVGDGVMRVVRLEGVRRVGEWYHREISFKYRGTSWGSLFDANRRDTRIYRTAKEAAKVLGGKMERRSKVSTKTPAGVMEIGK